MSKSNGKGMLGPRANSLGLEWEEPKLKKKEKKKQVQSQPKKQKKHTNKHDPRTKSQNYTKPETIDLGIDRPKLKELMELILSHKELPKIITYEVEYLDRE